MARLYEQAEEAAVATERNRLARDLHDAVSQTLFSASLIAKVLPRLWERKPEEGRRRLEEVRRLTRGALAEMRTLLLELRPKALVEADLGDLLRQLTEAFIGRARIPRHIGSGRGMCLAARCSGYILSYRPGGIEQRRQARWGQPRERQLALSA
jgi:signal transduction histidine kinase